MTERITIAELASLKKKKKRSKYGVAPKEERTWNGVVYMSKAEMQYHQSIHIDPSIESIELQPKVKLGEDTNCKPDFLITFKNGFKFYVDVKGMETPSFRRVKKLWKKYGTLPLHVVKKKGKKFVVTEVVERKV